MLQFNRRQLEHGLELAIGESESLYADVDKGYRLRVPICGFSSATICNWLGSNEVDNAMLISKPGLPFNIDGEHVIAQAHLGTGNTLIIDSTYGQFMTYVGLDPYLDMELERSLYPKDKIITFPVEETELIIGSFARFADNFRYQNSDLIKTQRTFFSEEDGEPADWYAPLSEASSAEIEATFLAIWNPENMEPFEDTAFFLKDTQRLARVHLQKVPLKVLGIGRIMSKIGSSEV